MSDAAQRPTGIDPDEVCGFEIKPYGTVYLGWIPGLKWESLSSTQRRNLAEAQIRSDQDAELRAHIEAQLAKSPQPDDEESDPLERRERIVTIVALQHDPKFAEQSYMLDRELVRCAVRGWDLEGVPDPDFEDHKLPYGDTHKVLTGSSLHALDRAEALRAVAVCAWAYYAMTPAEKKSVRISFWQTRKPSTAACAESPKDEDCAA